METATVVEKSMNSIELSTYQNPSSPYNFVQSSVRQSSDIRQDTEFARLMNRIQAEYENNQLASARECINQAPLSFQTTFDLQVHTMELGCESLDVVQERPL
jgi:hypothetical protein